MDFVEKKNLAYAILYEWHRNRTETIHAERIGLPQSRLWKLRNRKIKKMPIEIAVEIISERDLTIKAEEKARELTQQEKRKILLACDKKNAKMD